MAAFQAGMIGKPANVHKRYKTQAEKVGGHNELRLQTYNGDLEVAPTAGPRGRAPDQEGHKIPKFASMSEVRNNVRQKLDGHVHHSPTV